MLTRSRVLVIVLLLVALVILLYLFNPWVYAYKPEFAFSIDVSTGRPYCSRGSRVYWLYSIFNGCSGSPHYPRGFCLL
jgi:hypothetical protein